VIRYRKNRLPSPLSLCRMIVWSRVTRCATASDPAEIGRISPPLGNNREPRPRYASLSEAIFASAFSLCAHALCSGLGCLSPAPLPSEGEYRHEQRNQQQDGLAAVLGHRPALVN
jgi:hypothetical protein